MGTARDMQKANAMLAGKLVERDSEIAGLKRQVQNLTTERDVYKGGMALIARQRNNLLAAVDWSIHHRLVGARSVLGNVRLDCTDEISTQDDAAQVLHAAGYLRD